VTYEWSPEPTPEERAALERALERLLGGDPDPRGAWWRAGVGDALALALEPQLVRLEHEPGREALPAEEP
jgi:hypothetical protein